MILADGPAQGQELDSIILMGSKLAYSVAMILFYFLISTIFLIFTHHSL